MQNYYHKKEIIILILRYFFAMFQSTDSLYFTTVTIQQYTKLGNTMKLGNL
jgi:hypothetical protein